jgi:hypothetical protein
VLAGLSDVIMEEVKGKGVFMLHGLLKIKTRVKPASKAGKREVFGKMIMVKAKPAKTLVKALALSGLKGCL